MIASGALLFSFGCSDATDGVPSAPQGGTTSAAGTGTGGSTAGQTSQGGTGSPAGGQGTTAGSATGGTAAQAGTSAGGTGTGGTSAGGTSSGGTGTGGTSSGGPCGTGSIFCTDFNAAAIPTELLYYPEYERAMQKTITLDSTVVRGTGGGSLKVVGSGFSQMLGVAVPSKFWGRVYLRSATDIQMGHNTYVAAGTETGDPNAGEYIRIGEHQCQLELNRKSDDKELLSNGGMYMCSGGIKLLKDTWYCLEFSYDGPGKEVKVFVDNTEVTALHATDWGPYDYKIFKLGFEKYHGAEKTLWYDDLALATERVQCLP